MKPKQVSFIRYPGGKQRVLGHILHCLPSAQGIDGRFVEPFVGGGAAFFALKPRCAVLGDINEELIGLYRGIRGHPREVWKIFKGFPMSKEAYYQIRDDSSGGADLASRAARTLYLNRTCFKGMWRHNANGQFNVGYGGEARRWVVSEDSLLEVSRRLRRASLKCSDFEPLIDACGEGDFIFADPPYRPGQREMHQAHYVYQQFRFADHRRLASALKRASERDAKWALIVSTHPDILDLYKGHETIVLPVGTGERPGLLTANSEEALIRNYGEVQR